MHANPESKDSTDFAQQVLEELRAQTKQLEASFDTVENNADAALLRLEDLEGKLKKLLERWDAEDAKTTAPQSK